MYGYVYVHLCMLVRICLGESVCELQNQKVVLVERVLIRACENLSTSLDKGLWHGEWAGLLEGGQEKDVLRKENEERRLMETLQNVFLFYGLLFSI